MRRLGLLAAGLALASAGVYAQQTIAPVGAEATIGKVRAAYQTAAKAQDGAAIAKLYAADGQEMPPNAPVAKGRAAIEAYHKQFAQQFMLHALAITPTETKAFGDHGYDIGTYTQQLMAMKGGQIINDKGKYLVLLKKDAAGAWVITHLIYNSDNPLPTPPAK
jgi:uncharacterized protein (TIGR02246 family)